MTQYDPLSIIRVLVDRNPKRLGSAAYTKFIWYEDATVQDYLAKGGTLEEVEADVAHGYIAVEPPHTAGLNVRETIDRPAMYRYQQDLWRGIAAAHNVRYMAIPVKNGKRSISHRHCLVGHPKDVEVAKKLGEMTEQRINAACPWRGTECVSRSAISWKEGCVATILERLQRVPSAGDAQETQLSDIPLPGKDPLAYRDGTVAGAEIGPS